MTRSSPWTTPPSPISSDLGSQAPADHHRRGYSGGLRPGSALRHPHRHRAGGETLKLMAFGKATTDGTSYYMLMNGAGRARCISSPARSMMSLKTHLRHVRLPELPVLTEETITVSPSRAPWAPSPPPTMSVGMDDAEDTDEDHGRRGQLRHLDLRREDGRHRQRDAPVFAGLELSTAVRHQVRGLQAHRRGRGLCGFGSPTAGAHCLLRHRLRHGGTLTLTLGAESVDGDGYYVRMDDDTTIYQWTAPRRSPRW